MSHLTADQPMAEINTTPLIDVMLVLLIMFIITIPVATHSVDVDVGMHECFDCPLSPVSNRVVIEKGDTLRWNGAAITRSQLAGLLQRTRTLPVEPELQFEPHADASYDASAKALAVIEASGVTRFGFVGNERYRHFAGR